MVTTDDLMGGEWEQAWRDLKVQMEGWIDGRDISRNLYAVHRAAKIADQATDRAVLLELDRCVKQLERAVLNHASRLVQLQREVGYFVAAVTQARALGAQAQLEQDAIRAAALHDPRFADE